ncbi:ANTAR domain-containing protein [Kineococcus endophyticus]|uniref:ANTAR domain-containing protein n=1 Tax=Kineococcus endophyticus TaxID=1181883 RepID=A0ABV3P957_9ACTN
MGADRALQREHTVVDDDLSLQLQVVTEELAVADDELAAQQREIDELLARELDARRTASAVVRSVPVPVLVTDAAGAIVEANLAAATLLGVPAARLVRKPVQALVPAPARSAVRDLVSAAAGSRTVGGTVDVSPRSGPDRSVRIVITGGARRLDGRSVLTWVLADATPAQGTADSESPAALHAVAALTALPVGDLSPHELLTRVAALATQAVAGASWTSVVLGDPAEPAELAADSEEAQRIDGAQWRAGEGPAATAYRDGVAVVSADLRQDARWPVLAGPAGQTPVRSALALPIRSRDLSAPSDVRGVLTVYGPEPGAFAGEVQVDRALVFAEAASALLHDLDRIAELRTTAENLTLAMRSRATIEQAKGLVAGWLGCSVEEAFEVLTRLSQDRNVKLRDLAALAVADPSRHDLRPVLAHAHERMQSRRAQESAQEGSSS